MFGFGVLIKSTASNLFMPPQLGFGGFSFVGVCMSVPH